MKDPVDVKMVEAAIYHFNGEVELLMKDGWYPYEDVSAFTEQNKWHHWRHPNEKGTFSIGAAMLRRHERFLEKNPRFWYVSCPACSGEGCSDVAQNHDDDYRCNGSGEVQKDKADRMILEFARRNSMRPSY